MVSGNDLRDNSVVRAHCSPICGILAGAPFTASRNHPVLVRHDSSHLFPDVAVARGRFVPLAGRVASGGFPVRYGHSYLPSLTPALLSHPSRGPQGT